jgi:recombination protein RecA
VKVVKNKLAPPFREVEFDILYGQGISRSGDLVDLGSDLGIVEKSGAWFSFGGERIGQGRENAKTYLEQHPDAMDKIETFILTKSGIKRALTAAATTTATATAANLQPNGNGTEDKATKKTLAIPSKPAN